MFRGPLGRSAVLTVLLYFALQVTKKLAGGIADTASWMANIGNELGEVLNCVLTTGEGAGLDDVCQGIVRRYRDAGEPEPEVIYVDRDCCSGSGVCNCCLLFPR
jgi:hypothetical protein